MVQICKLHKSDLVICKARQVYYFRLKKKKVTWLKSNLRQDRYHLADSSNNNKEEETKHAMPILK